MPLAGHYSEIADIGDIMCLMNRSIEVAGQYSNASTRGIHAAQ